MNKKLKTPLITISILMLALLLIFIMGNNGVEAAGIGSGKLKYHHDDNGTTSINIDNFGTKKTISGIIFKNNGVFCVQSGQDIFDDKDWYRENYQAKGPITIGIGTPYNTNIAKGLAYILSQDNGEGRATGDNNTDWYMYNDNPAQLALRYYIYNHYSADNVFSAIGVGNIHGDTNNFGYDVNHDGKITYNNGKYDKNNNYTKGTVYGNNDYGKKAKEIYDNAKDIADGSSNGNYYAEIYTLTNDKQQNLIVVKTAEEEPAITELIINKKDSSTGNNVSGAKFTITLNNISSAEGYSNNGNNTIIIPNINTGYLNDNAGQIVLKNLKVADSRSPINITIKEESAPEGYKKTNEITTVVLTKNTSGGYDVSYVSSGHASADNNVVTVDIPNQPVMNLKGKVWQDGQIGEKEVSLPDGIKEDTENGLDEVLVELYNVDKNGNIIGNSVKDTYTKNGGNYEFTDVPKTENGYKVVFKYDGINYKETKASGSTGTDSKASENTNERNIFNGNFNTIISGQSNKGIKLTYNSKGNEKEPKPYLDVNMDGTNPANKNEADFQIRAISDEKYGWWRKDEDKDKRLEVNINCGLVRKELDLGTVMQVDSTTLKINDKTTKYDYGKSLEDNLKYLDVDKLIEQTKNNTVSTYLETSDYYYRIEDYEGSNGEITNEDATDIYNSADKLKELRVFVTYKVDLINQTANSGVTVNELAYYYDKNYTLVGIGRTVDETTGEAINDASITREPISDAFGKSAIKVSNINATSGGTSVIQSLYFTFEINKMNNSLPEAIATQAGLNCANIVEITSYSTNNSLIDRDSAPGNLVDGIDKEDDTSKSNGLKIVLKPNDRTIVGTVFEDTNKDGLLNENETKVNNVIVQLIEIRSKASGGLGEFIWQQTVSGSNKVVSLTNKGNEIRNYEYKGDNVVGNGEYKFTGFIPGNYIIRYIYGDGTTYDFDENGNIVKYNGQDYKSTKDPNYTVELYNTAEYSDGASIARDNEARRLEVMAYSTTIDANIGEALSVLNKDIANLSETEKNVLNKYYDSLDKGNVEVKYALSALKKSTKQTDITFDNISDENKYMLIKYYVSLKTWMCAETSRINVPIDSTTTAIDTNATTVGLEYADHKVTFNNMNFGLALRPETKLILEKHITGLKITPNGTGVQPIVDATADIEQIINGTTVDTKGVTSGLATIKSERNERGFWKVETDIEELAQGAQLEVEYTYVIRNESDEDYLSNILANAYEGYQTNEDGTRSNEKLGMTYQKYLEELKYDTRGKTDSYGTYLGQYYYNGNSEGCAEVLSRVEELEEALNNQLKYDETVSGEDFKKTNIEAVPKNTYDTDGNLVDNVTNGTKNIETVVKTTSASDFLAKSKLDYSKTLKLTTVLTSFNNGAGYYPSYIAEITKYSNAAGRRNMEAEPANLSYVHSEDTRKTIATDNEVDEFWGEQIIISKPTGFNKQLAIQITIVTISSIAVIGAGIVLIKKFVLKK